MAEAVPEGMTIPHDKMTELVMPLEMFHTPFPAPKELLRAREEVVAGQYDMAAASLKEAVDADYWDPALLREDAAFIPLHSHPAYVEALKRQEERSGQIDRQCLEELLAMAIENQELLREADDLTDPSWKMRLSRLHVRHTARLKEFVDAKGWPAISRVGRRGAFAAWVVLESADEHPEIQAELLQAMERAVREGEASGSQYANAVDRHLMSMGKPQRYGTLLMIDRSTMTVHPRRMEDPANVDARLADIGLPSLFERMRTPEKTRPYNVSVEPMLRKSEREALGTEASAAESSL